MHCGNCGTLVERGGFCFECGFPLMNTNSPSSHNFSKRHKNATAIFWLAISYGIFSFIYSATLATLFGINQADAAYPYNFWFQALAVFFAVLAAVYSKRKQFEKVPWMLFFALVFEGLFRIYQTQFVVPVLGALADFGPMSADGYVGLAFLRLFYHLTIVGLLVAFVLSWFILSKQTNNK